MDLLAPGDSFSGTASYKDCLTVEDHPVSIVVSQSAGNAFRGTALFRANDRVRSKQVVGFFYIPDRQLLISAEGYDSDSLAMVCTHAEGSLSDMQCSLLTSYMTQACGKAELNRDPSGNG